MAGSQIYQMCSNSHCLKGWFPDLSNVFYSSLPEWLVPRFIKCVLILTASRAGSQIYQMCSIPHCLNGWFPDLSNEFYSSLPPGLVPRFIKCVLFLTASMASSKIYQMSSIPHCLQDWLPCLASNHLPLTPLVVFFSNPSHYTREMPWVCPSVTLPVWKEPKKSKFDFVLLCNKLPVTYYVVLYLLLLL